MDDDTVSLYCLSLSICGAHPGYLRVLAAQSVRASVTRHSGRDQRCCTGDSAHTLVPRAILPSQLGKACRSMGALLD